MGAPTITDILSVPTQAQLQAAMTSQLVALGVPADKWRVGGTYSTIRAIVATLLAGFAQTLVFILSGAFLYAATGSALTMLAQYVYAVTRVAATFATGSVTLTNAGGGIFTFAAGQVTFQNSRTKAFYTNLDPVSLAALGTQTLRVQASVAGSASSAAPGQIDTIVTTMTAVAVGNAASVVGLDAQNDDSLRAVCLSSIGAQSVRGPRSAYQYAVSQATRPDGSGVNINRVIVSPASHGGIVTVTAASPSGAADPTDVAAVVTAVEQFARPGGVTASIISAIPVAYNPAITVYARAQPGMTTGILQLAAAAAVDDAISGYPIGGLQGALYGSGIDAIVGTASPAIFRVDGTFDLPLAASQVATNQATVGVVIVSS